MGMIFERIRSIWKDRRKRDEPVAVERRDKKTRKEIQHRLDDALDDFERTVSIKREDLFKFVANDRQQVVIFSSYREICPEKGPEIGAYRVCRHPKHPDAANASLLICDEEKCPRLDEALKGAA